MHSNMRSKNAAFLSFVLLLTLFSIDAHATSFSYVSLFNSADIIVKTVILLLIGSSVWSWTIIITKWLVLRKINKKMLIFEKAFWSGQALDELYDNVKKSNDNPLTVMFANVMQELNSYTSSFNDLASRSELIRESFKTRLYQVSMISINKSMRNLDSNLTFLAITSSAGPFIGLFGTVWGIMSSFQGIAVAKNVSLAIVAPGIAEALMATAIGLIAAIPAMVFYNKFISDINYMEDVSHDFAKELLVIINKQLEQ